MPVELVQYMLEFGEYDYLEHYGRVTEDSDCQKKMFEVRSVANDPGLDETLFHPLKLKTNWELLEKIFLEGVAVDPTKPDIKEVVYHGDFFGERVLEGYFKDLYELAKGKGKMPVFMAVLKYVVQKQMKNMGDTQWLRDLLEVVDEENGIELFKTFLDHSEMTPVILRIFLEGKDKVTFAKLYLEGETDATERTFRCIVYEHGREYAGPLRGACEESLEPFKDGGRGEFLNVLARSGREDRALHSTMARGSVWNPSESDIDEGLIKYSVLSLFDLNRLRKSQKEAAELAGVTLPPAFDGSELSFKERFGRWLRGGLFVCNDDLRISFKDVLKTIELRPISINRKLSEPLFVVGDKALTEEEAAGQKGVKLTRVVDALIFASDQIGKGSKFKEEYQLEDSRIEELEVFGLFAAFSEGRRITIAPEKWDRKIKQFSWELWPINAEELAATMHKPDIVEELTTAMRKQEITLP
jgi:hypothetical protein